MAIDRLWLVNVTAMNTQPQNLFELFNVLQRLWKSQTGLSNDYEVNRA